MARNSHADPSSTKPIRTVAELEDKLTEPSSRLIESMARLDGDIMIIGAGGKMGPTLAGLAIRAITEAGAKTNVTAVSSFSQKGLRAHLDKMGVSTIQADLLAPGAVDALPDARNVVYMAGRKFGSTGAESLTWATNVFLPGLVARRFKDSRIVSFSTGAIYPLMPVLHGGSTEQTPLDPVGEYAMSCVGRERMFDYFAETSGAHVLHFRLNYAVELRYGVLVDVAEKVWGGKPIDLSMGHFNCVWQGYANSVALQCFPLAGSPARALNVTGPELVSVRWVATRLGGMMGKKPQFLSEEAPTALLSNAAECHRLFGYPEIDLATILEWVAHWTMKGGEKLNKPTHFETRDGRF